MRLHLLFLPDPSTKPWLQKSAECTSWLVFSANMVLNLEITDLFGYNAGLLEWIHVKELERKSESCVIVVKQLY